eukprot:2847532-Lingulodinium_polyedra.AAC.1
MEVSPAAVRVHALSLKFSVWLVHLRKPCDRRWRAESKASEASALAARRTSWPPCLRRATSSA